MKANILDYFTTYPIFGKILVLYLWAKMLTTSLQKSMGDKIDFLLADIRQMFPQNDTIILGLWPGMPKLPQISFLFLCNILTL